MTAILFQELLAKASGRGEQITEPPLHSNWFPNRFWFAPGTELGMAFAERGILRVPRLQGNRYLGQLKLLSVYWELNVQPSGEGAAWLLFITCVTICAVGIVWYPKLKVWCCEFWFCHSLPTVCITFQDSGIFCSMRKCNLFILSVCQGWAKMLNWLFAYNTFLSAGKSFPCTYEENEWWGGIRHTRLCNRDKLSLSC